MKGDTFQEQIVESPYDALTVSKQDILEESVLMRLLKSCASIVGPGLMTFMSFVLTSFALDATNRVIEPQIAENQYWRVRNAKIQVIHSKNVQLWVMITKTKNTSFVSNAANLDI